MVHSGCFLLFRLSFDRFCFLCLVLKTGGELRKFGLNVCVRALSVFELLDLLLTNCFYFLEELFVKGLLLWVYGLLDLRVFVVRDVFLDACYFINLLLVPL